VPEARHQQRLQFGGLTSVVDPDSGDYSAPLGEIPKPALMSGFVVDD
jgi:hypothetical protein